MSISYYGGRKSRRVLQVVLVLETGERQSTQVTPGTKTTRQIRFHITGFSGASGATHTQKYAISGWQKPCILAFRFAEIRKTQRSRGMEQTLFHKYGADTLFHRFGTHLVACRGVILGPMMGVILACAGGYFGFMLGVILGLRMQ